jgi:hypothetical protein
MQHQSTEKTVVYSRLTLVSISAVQFVEGFSFIETVFDVCIIMAERESKSMTKLCLLFKQPPKRAQGLSIGKLRAYP